MKIASKKTSRFGVFYLVALFTQLFSFKIAYSIDSGFYNNPIDSPHISMIQSAQSSVDIEIYEMKDPDVLSAIRQALKKGVVFRVIHESMPLGSKCSLFEANPSSSPECENQRQLIEEIRENGGTYIPFSKNLCGVEGKSCFQHGKIIVVDSKQALISTGNFNSTSICNLGYNPDKCDQDYSYVTSDQNNVRTLEAIFEKDLQGDRYKVENILSENRNNKLTVSPVGLEKIVTFIKSARKNIQLENQYLNEPTINKALIETAKKGIQIEVTVSSVCSFGPPTQYKKDQVAKTYSLFDKVGISSSFYTKEISVRGKPGYLHSKAIIVDNKHAWIGSMNGSTQAATKNREFGIFFDDAKSVSLLSRIMKDNHNNVNSETWRESLNCLRDR